MLATLIRKEILENLLSLRFGITCLLCFVVLLVSFAVRTLEYEQVLDDYQRNSTMDRLGVERRTQAWEMVWRPYNVHQAPNALKIFVRGIENRNGGMLRLVHERPADFSLADLANRALPLFPSIDLVTFVGVIMSLLAIVFAYDAVCGEKQRGTLRLILSYPVPRDTVLLSKWIGGFVTLIIPYLFAVLAMISILLVRKTVSLTDDQWIKLGAILGLSLLYLAVIYSLALCVSCYTSRPETSIMILVTIWVVLLLAIPNVSPHVARVISPTQAAEEIETQRIKMAVDTWKRLVDEPMAQYVSGPGEHWSKQWAERMARVMEAHLERHRQFDKIDQQLAAQLQQQTEVARWIARLSPYASFAMASAELADTGVDEKQRFLSQVRQFQPVLIKYGHEQNVEELQMRFKNGVWPPPWPDWRKAPIPRFAYVPATGSAYVKAVAIDAGILLALAFILFMASYARFLKYDVR